MIAHKLHNLDPMAKARRPHLRSTISSDSDLALSQREQLFVLISQIAYHRERKLEAELAPLGVSVQLWRSMVVIHRIVDCSMSDLSRFSLADRTTLTRSVDQLVAKDMVERYVSPEDRRLVLLRLTADGVRLFDTALAITRKVNAEIVEHAPPPDTKRLADTLEGLLGGLVPDAEELATLVGFAREGVGEAE